MIRVGVVGYGYWGPNLARNFADIPGAQLVAVGDVREDRLARAKARHPSIWTTSTIRDLVESPHIDALVIATPVTSHFDLAMAALEAGKHVLVEKPLTTNSEQATRLIDAASRRRRILMVDHTFVYSSAVRKIEELVASNVLGRIYYCDSMRVNLGLFRHDVNVIWDLAMHDLAIMDFVLPGRPRSISATGVSHVPGEPENVAFLTLYYADDLIAHINVNWLAPVKVRRMLFGGSDKMIVYDDIEPSEKVKVYDRGIALNGNGNGDGIYKMLVGYRTGDLWAPHLDLTEALRTEALHFIDCIERDQRPLTDGVAGLRVVELLEAADRSMREQGRLVLVLGAGAVA